MSWSTKIGHMLRLSKSLLLDGMVQASYFIYITFLDGVGTAHKLDYKRDKAEPLLPIWQARQYIRLQYNF